MVGGTTYMGTVHACILNPNLTQSIVRTCLNLPDVELSIGARDEEEVFLQPPTDTVYGRGVTGGH